MEIRLEKINSSEAKALIQKYLIEMGLEISYEIIDKVIEQYEHISKRNFKYELLPENDEIMKKITKATSWRYSEIRKCNTDVNQLKEKNREPAKTKKVFLFFEETIDTSNDINKEIDLKLNEIKLHNSVIDELKKLENKTIRKNKLTLDIRNAVIRVKNGCEIPKLYNDIIEKPKEFDKSKEF